MANTNVDVTLPSGELVTVTVDESWTDAQITEALVASGEYTPAVAEAPAVEEGGTPGTTLDRALMGYADTLPIQGVAAEYLEQKLGTRDDVTTEKMVPREEGLPEDVPAFEGDPGVKMVPQTFTQPGITEDEIRARQNAQHEIQNRTVFPELMKDADATRDSTAFKMGAGASYLMDLIAAPIPGAQAKNLATLAMKGPVLRTAAGRAAVGKAGLEGAKTGAVFAGSDDALRQLHAKGEVDLNQVGVATVLGGAGGLVLAPVLSANLGKVLGHFATKLDTAKPATADELRDLAPEMTEDQISNLLAGFNEAEFAAKYEPKAKLSMDTNVNAAKRERAGKQESYEAKRDIARAKSAEARTDLAVQAETKANRDPMVDIKRNENAPRHTKDSKPWFPWSKHYKKGDLKGGFKFFNGAIERLEHIAAGFSPAIRKVGQQTNSNVARDVTRADLFFKHKDYQRMSKVDKRSLDTAMADSDGPKIREITGKYGDDLTANYEKNVRGLIDEVGTLKRARDNSKGFVSGYHPRIIKNVAAARRRLGHKQRTELNEALRAKEDKKGSPLDGFETEAVVRQYLRPGGNDKLTNRRIDTVGEGNIDLYEDPRDALMSYLHRHHEEIATREFFENTLGVQGFKDGEMPDKGSISAALTESMLRGDLPEDDLSEAADIIAAIFGDGRQAPSNYVQNTKSLATVGVIGNPVSTMTQVQDLAQLMDMYGIPATLRSLFGKNIENSYEMGLRSVVQDTKTNHGWKKLLNGFMQASGFQKLDKVMATTGVNASLRTNFALAKKNPTKALKKMTDLGFAENRARQLVKDLADRKVTQDVRVLNIVEQGKIRPIAVEDLPVWAVKHPDGRVFTTLLTWTFKQANRIRNGAYADMRNGHPIRGTRKLASLLGLMGATGTGVGAIKDFMKGEELDLSAEGLTDSFTSNMLALGMSGKYLVDALDRGAGGVSETLTPFFGIWGDILTGMYKGGEALYEGEGLATAGDELSDGIGSLRNYKKIVRDGPLPEMGMDVLKDGAGLFGAAYDTLFEDGTEQAIETDSVRRVHPDPSPEGNGGDLMPPVENVVNDYTLDNTLKGWENSVKDGFSNETGKWFTHKSVEKGLPTLAYGHKITARENRLGSIKIGDERVDYRQGLTEAQANTLFEQDTAVARQHVLNTVSIPLSPNEMVALTSLMFNIGPGKAGCKPVCWHNSKARKALNRGDREEFMKETYDPVYGFVKVNGEPHDGLIKRRAKEKVVFMGR